MSELTVGVNASETLWTVDAVPDPEFGFYTIGSEIVEFTAGFPVSEPGYAVGQTFPAKIRVVRGTNGTTPASHLAGAALTAANAFAGGGGGLDVTDGTTTVPGATTLQVATVVDAGGGTAAVTPTVISPTDPGAIGAGYLWLQTDPDENFSAAQLWVRDSTNTGWVEVGAGMAFDSTDTRVLGVVTNPVGAFLSGISFSEAFAKITFTPVAGDLNAVIQLDDSLLTGGITIEWTGPGATRTLKLNDNGFVMTGLPTADPLYTGALWNDNGTLKVSA